MDLLDSLRTHAGAPEKDNPLAFIDDLLKIFHMQPSLLHLLLHKAIVFSIDQLTNWPQILTKKSRRKRLYLL